MELYIHIPFCVRKCHYCDFLSYPCETDTGRIALQGQCGILMDDYVDALVRELRERRAEWKYSEHSANTGFIGGGTPSVLPVRLMDRVLSAASEYGSFDEYTIECNPGTLDREKLALYRSYGVNRISLGLQSTDDTELRLLGRIHDYAAFLSSYDMVRAAGFDNVNVDLISAIPGQTVDSWERSLCRVAELRPEHISAYSLIIEEGTRFGDLYGDCTAPAGYPALPSEDDERRMYEMTGDILGAYGYGRYEISNYALPGCECKHNLGYWTGEEYIGCGLGAASYRTVGNRSEAMPSSACGVGRIKHGERLKCTSELASYVEDPIGTRETEEKLDEADLMSEYAILHLRLIRGIDCDDFADRFGRDIREVYRDVIAGHLKDRLMEECSTVDESGRTHRSLRLTKRGLDLANTVMADFLNT